jgi:uncharacterized protein YjbJ (UPF0337 family)
MITAQQLQGNWSTIRGKVKEKWGQLTDDDLQVASGNVDQLIGKIQQRTGEARQQIESFLNDLAQQPAFTRAKEAVSEYAQGAMHTVRDGYEQVSDRVRDGYRRAESMVQEHPAASVTGVFVCGLITGVFIGLVLSNNK